MRRVKRMADTILIGNTAGRATSHSSRELGLILSSGVVHVESTHSPCYYVGFPWVLQFSFMSQTCAGW